MVGAESVRAHREPVGVAVLLPTDYAHVVMPLDADRFGRLHRVFRCETYGRIVAGRFLLADHRRLMVYSLVLRS